MVNKASFIGVSSCTSGISSPLCITSETFCRQAPNFPPGWRCLKSVFENPFLSNSAMAKMSPRTMVAVVDDVGANPKGHASPSSGKLSHISAAFPRALFGFFVMPINGIP